MWCDIHIPSMFSVAVCLSWIDNMRNLNGNKDRMFVIVAIMWWMLWKFQNNSTFNTHSMRKCDIYDNIRLFSINLF